MPVHEPGAGVAIFAGGGSGGHLYPALALAAALQELRPEIRPFFIGATRGVEARVFPAEGVDHVLLPVRGWARRRILENALVLPALLASLARVGALFRRLRPELVVVTGGYAGAPAGLVASFTGVPLALQEQNSIPGLTTRMLARRAQQIHLAFEEASDRLPDEVRGRILTSGNPIRVPESIDRLAAREALGVPREGVLVLVVGGSQGSAALNERMVDAVRRASAGELARPEGVNLLWATGPAHLDPVRAALGSTPPWVFLRNYLDEMPLALAAADVTVSRGGAISTSEFMAWGLPMILVPLPTSAENHQEENARALEAAGVAIHLPEAGLTGPTLWRRLMELLGDPARLEAQRRAAAERGRPDAAHRIATSLCDLLPPIGASSAGGATS